MRFWERSSHSSEGHWRRITSKCSKSQFGRDRSCNQLFWESDKSEIYNLKIRYFNVICVRTYSQLSRTQYRKKFITWQKAVNKFSLFNSDDFRLTGVFIFVLLHLFLLPLFIQFFPSVLALFTTVLLGAWARLAKPNQLFRSFTKFRFSSFSKFKISD